MLRLLLVAGGFALAGCTSSPSADAGRDAGTGVRIEMAWRVRCFAEPGSCDYPDRSVAGFEAFRRAHTCRVVESPTTRVLSFGAMTDAATGSMTGVIVNDAEFMRAGGGAIGAGGELLFSEAGGVWAGAVGPLATALRTCTIDATFTEDADGPLIMGELGCTNTRPFTLFMAPPPSPLRDLTGPGEGPEAERAPVRFALHGCSGYTPD